MIVQAQVLLHGGWWNDAASRAVEAKRLQAALNASYRLGEVVLDIDSTYQPLLDDLLNSYGDCLIDDGAARDALHVRCSVRTFEGSSLVAVRFEVPGDLPHLCEIGLSLVRHRAELQHFSVRDLDFDGWRLIANALDERSPLMAAGARDAVVDIRIEPPDFLLNFVVGIAELAQPSILFVHGGGVVIDGNGTLLVGRSGQGKSSTTVTLGSRGHLLLGDETVGIRSEPCEIIAFRRTLKLRPGPRAKSLSDRLNAVPHMTRIDAQGLECDWVRAGVLFPTPAPVSAPLRNVFFLRDFRDRAAVEPFVPTLEHLEELKAMAMCLYAIVSWPSSAAQRLIRFMRIVDVFARCQCYFLDLGTPEETAALIERTVRNNAERA
jgi:hypothetical protein